MANMPDTLQAARLKVSMSRPYLNSVLWSLHPIETKGLGTLAVDAFYRLYYDPECDRKWDVNMLAGALQHEVYHLIRDHHWRADLFMPDDRMAWNVAADMEINDDLQKEGVKLPDKCVYPSLSNLPDGEMAEWYYQQFPVKNVKMPSQGGEGESQPGAGKCGSCAGQGQPWEMEGEPKPGEGGVKPWEHDMIKRQVAQDVKTAKSEGRGDIPEWLDRWADTIMSPKVNWKKELAAIIRRSIADAMGAVDFSYKRPSRRNHGKVIMPSLRQPVPSIAVVVDTSGSVGDKELAEAMAEIKGILTQCGLKDGLYAVVCDADVKSAKQVFSAKQVKPSGGGGTDMRVGINEALKKHPHVIVVLTDGYTPWPDAPVSAKIVAAIIRGTMDGLPKFIRGVKVDA